MDSKFEDELLADSGDDDSQSQVVVSSSEVPVPQGEAEELKTSSDDDDSDLSGDEVDARVMGKAQVKASDSSDVDTSDDDEDEGMEVDEDALQAELTAVKDKLAEDPWGYHLHVEKIRLLKAMGDLEEARRAREKMNEEYPLSPTMWLEWIRDEQKIISDDSEREYVFGLFERAVNEYLSVDVWLEYVSFCLGNMDDDGGIQKCRDVFEMALSNCGLHVSMASLLWDAYRDFEGALIGSQTTEELQAAQEQRYVSLCRRQLSVPLFDMDRTFVTVEQKLGGIDESTRSAYENAKQRLREIEGWETKLIKDLEYTEKRGVFAEYIETEKKRSAKGNPVRVQCLYERALADMPLDHYLWNDYVDFLSRHLKNPQVILKVAERAVRNCGYSSVAVWLSYMKVVEVFYTQSLEEEDESKKSSLLLAKILKVFEDACIRIGTTLEGAGTLWLKYLECLRRQVDLGNRPKIVDEGNDSSSMKDRIVVTLRKTFILAEDHLRRLVEEPNDFIGEIAMFRARFEAQIESSMTESVRNLWKDLYRRGYSANFSFWNQYIGEEIKYKGLGPKQIRKEMSKAMKFVRDYPQLMANVWLNFERDNGDFSTLGIAETQISEALEKMPGVSTTAYEDVRDSAYNSKKDKGSFNKKANDFGKGTKRKWEEKEPMKFSPKKGKYGSQGDETDGNIGRDDGGFKKPAIPPPPGRRMKENQELPPSSSVAESAKKSDSTQPQPAPVKHDSTKDSKTVFLSNLDFSVDEAGIKDFFTATGEIEEIRVVKDFKGNSKGFAYVVFKQESCAKDALSLDRKPLGKRPAFVSKCDPDKSTRQPQFKYARSLERNKLFVKGLPFEMGEKDVRVMFEAFGPVKDCRLVTYRNGHSKGLAYVEFEKEAHASAAILKSDGSTIKDKVISVAISNPPMKGQPQSLHFVSTKSEPNLRRSRNVFVPRIVQSSTASNASKEPAKPRPSASSNNSLSTETPTTTKPSGAKSNDDFRKMFMKS